MFSTLKNNYIRYLVKKNKFLEATLFCKKWHRVSGWMPYLYARLSMYPSVLSLPVSQNPFSQIAYLISLVAEGEYRQAEEFLNQLKVANCFSRKQWIYLAESLATYRPDWAWSVLNQVDNPPALLQSVILMCMGKCADSYALLTALSSTEKAKIRDFELLLANVGKGSVQDKLSVLNSYFERFGLEPVSLLDENSDLRVMNIKGEKIKTCHTDALVSILTTTYNNVDRLEQSILSLRQQSYAHIEMIIIDDASTDDTAKRVTQWMAEDARIRYIRLPRNVGTFAAKTIGLMAAQGEFVTCQDSDDWAHPRKIEYQLMPLLKNKSLMFSTSQWLRICDDGTFYARRVFPFLRLNPASPMFRRKEVLERVGAWDCVRTGADSEFLHRLKLVFGPKGYIDIKKPLTLGAHRANSLMTAPDTGYDEHGVSTVRLEYWDAWTHWHLDCLKRGEMPKLSATPWRQARTFDVPEKLFVPPEDIQLCADGVGV